jgi:hypothetical protein
MRKMWQHWFQKKRQFLKLFDWLTSAGCYHVVFRIPLYGLAREVQNTDSLRLRIPYSVLPIASALLGYSSYEYYYLLY